MSGSVEAAVWFYLTWAHNSASALDGFMQKKDSNCKNLHDFLWFDHFSNSILWIWKKERQALSREGLDWFVLILIATRLVKGLIEEKLCVTFSNNYYMFLVLNSAAEEAIKLFMENVSQKICTIKIELLVLQYS